MCLTPSGPADKPQVSSECAVTRPKQLSTTGGDAGSGARDVFTEQPGDLPLMLADNIIICVFLTFLLGLRAGATEMFSFPNDGSGGFTSGI